MTLKIGGQISHLCFWIFGVSSNKITTSFENISFCGPIVEEPCPCIESFSHPHIRTDKICQICEKDFTKNKDSHHPKKKMLINGIGELTEEEEVMRSVEQDWGSTKERGEGNPQVEGERCSGINALLWAENSQHPLEEKRRENLRRVLRREIS